MYGSSSALNSSLESDSKYCFPIPKDYKFVRILGQGSFGTVVACVKEESGEVVAIKIFSDPIDARWEAHIMTILMQHSLDSSNIIKYQRTYSDSQTMSLMFELLDITLLDYINILRSPMRLEDIRSIIQQMAVAFDALKSIGVIHGDLKLNNIMMVDHRAKPLRIKLIDFGLALYRWQARPGRSLQTIPNRAPEIILGLPFSEAVDIWSLGCQMATMMFRVRLFPANTEYCLLKFITDLLGPPPKHLLNIGKKTPMFYKKIDGQWQLKTPEEHCPSWESKSSSLNDRSYNFRTLDETKTMRLERQNPREADERRECVELLKAMLQWDEKNRITPSGILNHPFITQSYLNSPSDLTVPSSNEPEATTSHKQMDVGTQNADKVSEALPPGVILVQPADSENRIHLGDVPSEDSNQSTHEDLSPRVSLVEPALPENRIHLGNVPTEDSDLSPHPTPAPASTNDATSNDVDTDLLTVTSESQAPKKKKNHFLRFFTWMKKTFSCTVDTVE